MNRPRNAATIVLVALLLVVFIVGRRRPLTGGPLRAVLSDVEHCTRSWLSQVADGGVNGVVLVIESSDVAYKEIAREAAQRVRERELSLCYWIEIARDASLADAHPELTAGLQGHDAWRLDAPGAPVPADGERLQAWPWVPILYAEAFELQLAKVEERLSGLPEPDGLFLNDLQGAPSACGCGNALCRWTVDYLGEPAAPLGQDPVAARFLERVRERHPGLRIIPVWTGECGPEAESAVESCHGVPCYTGRCWPALVDELRPIVESGSSIGLLLAEKVPVDPPGENHIGMSSVEELEDSIYAPVSSGLGGFPLELGKRGLELGSERLIPVLRCWDHSSVEGIRAQTRIANRHGAQEWVVALVPVEQDMEPRLVPREVR